MNWYEYADADEVRRTLESVLASHCWMKLEWKETWDDNKERTVMLPVDILPKDGYEIAEQLWWEDA